MAFIDAFPWDAVLAGLLNRQNPVADARPLSTQSRKKRYRDTGAQRRSHGGAPEHRGSVVFLGSERASQQYCTL